MKKLTPAALLLAALLFHSPAEAQSIGGNASLTAGTTSSQVALPTSTSLAFQSLLIVPAPGAASEVFYQFGTDSSVEATDSSPALPPGGMCVNSVGNAKNLAAKTDSGSVTLRLTLVPTCTPFSGAGGYGGGGGGGGGGAVYGNTAVGSSLANPPVAVGGTVDGTASGDVSVWKVLSGIGYVNCANCSGGGVSVAYGGAIGANGTPGGYKDTSGNFQPLLGDTTDGQWVNVKASALPSGAATQATLASVLSALGSPFQAGGSIGNTAFGLNAGSNIVGKFGIDQTTPGTTNGVQPLLSATGGWTPKLVTSLGTTVQSVKSSPGQVGKLFCDNPNSSAIYIETFDVAGTVTLGTTAPTQAYYIPAVSSNGFALPVQGDQYSNAIQIAAVTSVNGTTAPVTPGNCNVSYR